MLDNNNYQDPCDVACHYYMALQMTKCWTEFDSPLLAPAVSSSLKYLSIVCLGKKSYAFENSILATKKDAKTKSNFEKSSA